jgi:hypothetical protein
MKDRDLDMHVTVLGWLFIIGGAIVLLLGVVGFLFFAGIGLFAGIDSGDLAAVGILSVIGTAGLVFFGVLALPGLLAGYGLLKRRSWARILAIVLGIFELLNFPIGTAIGIYTLWVLLQEDAVVYFNREKEVALDY